MGNPTKVFTAPFKFAGDAAAVAPEAGANATAGVAAAANTLTQVQGGVGGDMPDIPTPPDINAGAYDAARKTAQDEETRRLRSGAGRASTILTGAGSSSPLGLARRTLGSAS